MGQTSKRRKQKHYLVNYVENTPVTRSQLKKLVRAKLIPEIYKEVVRSQRRKSGLFRVPDISFRSSKNTAEEKEEQFNADVPGCNEKTLLSSNCRSQSRDSLNEECYEGVGQKEYDNCLHETANSDEHEELASHYSAASTVSTSSDSDLQWQSDTNTGLEDIPATMSQRGNRTRKSLGSEIRSAASPGVITRSQLKQLANAKSVPEEYKHVIGGTQSSGSNQKSGKSSDIQKQSTPRRLSMTTQCKILPKKLIDKEKVHSSSEQNNLLEVEESIDVEMRDAADFSLEDHIINTSNIAHNTGGGSRVKNRGRGKDKFDDSALKNGRILNSNSEVCGDTYCDSSSREQSNTKMEVSEPEDCVLKDSVIVLSPGISLEQNEEVEVDSVCSKAVSEEIGNKNHDDERPHCSANKAILKREIQQDRKITVSKKIGRKRRGFSKVSSTSEPEILDMICSKEQGNAGVRQKNSICEPVDMSISEDCSGAEKIQCFSKSAQSDSEVSGSFTANQKNLAQGISDTNGKTKLLKREELSQIAPKSSEVSSVTSSSYNSGYEITPSKSQAVSKEQSLSTKTTDSGITGMVDSNPYCDSDSSTSEKQLSLDKTQNLKLVNRPDSVTKERQRISPGKSPASNSLGSTLKPTNLRGNESIPSCSGKTLDIRQPFLIKMRPTITEEPVDSDSDAESRKAIMLSAQRRIEQNLSATDSEGRRYSSHQTPSSSLPDAEDSDDAPPESMTFEAGRNTATESLRDAVESIRRDRQRRKEKRRARLEKLRQQKEEKLIRLKERLASQEDASCSSSEESGYEDEEVRHYKKKPLSREKAKIEKESYERTAKSKKKSSNVEGRVAKRKDVDNNTQQHIGTSNDLTKRLPDELLERLSEKAPNTLKVTHSEKAGQYGIDNRAISMQKKRKKAVPPSSEQSDEQSDSQSFKKPTNLDYIPLKSSTSTKFGIMSYDRVVNVSKSAAQKASEFRQNMMFGNRHKREPGNSSLIYQQKMKASGKDVFARKKF